MSYILEALKKLEERRRRETEPHRLSSRYAGTQIQKGRVPWGYLIIFALFLNAGIFLWWLHPWRSENAAETVRMSVPRTAPVYGPRDAAKETKMEESGSSGRQLKMSTKTGDDTSSGPEDGASTVLSQASRPPSDHTPGEKKIINISELPLSVSQKLPDLTISGHFYDVSPYSRVVTVGGRALHEGDVAAPGVKLERITPDGAVFSCEGYRFHKGVF
jgi:general secretion pathway protein B